MKYLIPLLIFLVLTINVEAKTTKVKVTYTIKTQSTASVPPQPNPTATPKELPTKSGIEGSQIVTEEGLKPSPPSGSIETLILSKFAEFGDAHIAVAIARAESGLRCDAHGDKSLTYVRDGVQYGASYGVFQIRHLPGRPDPSVLTDCEANINYAYNMRKAQGHYGAWSAYKNGSYLKHL